MTEHCQDGHDARQGLQYCAPAFDPCFEVQESYPNGDKLPGVWVTRPVTDSEGSVVGRIREILYPFAVSDLAPDDVDGEDALYYGGRYYDEAMGYTDPLDHDARIECFQAAELLYRHAAGRGNAVAYLCLGYVYSYDRCEGRYWLDPIMSGALEVSDQPYPREERAFECFAKAAEADICEACYKLGDLYKCGVGCEPDVGEAFRWYRRASELMACERPVILGSVALRLGECFEEAIGCRQDFARALEWYLKAVEGLEVAVDGGESWYDKALAGARAGVKRCRQELVP